MYNCNGRWTTQIKKRDEKTVFDNHKVLELGSSAAVCRGEISCMLFIEHVELVLVSLQSDLF